MKKRAVLYIDYEYEGNFVETTEKYKALKAKIENIVDGDPDIDYFDLDFKERRGNHRPDIRKMKFSSR